MKPTIVVLMFGAALAIGLAVGTQYDERAVAAPSGLPSGAHFTVKSDAPCVVSVTDQFGGLVYASAEVGPDEDGRIDLTPPLFEGMVIQVVTDDSRQPDESDDS